MVHDTPHTRTRAHTLHPVQKTKKKPQLLKTGGPATNDSQLERDERRNGGSFLACPVAGLFVFLGGGEVQFHGLVDLPVFLTDQFQREGPIQDRELTVGSGDVDGVLLLTGCLHINGAGISILTKLLKG